MNKRVSRFTLITRVAGVIAVVCVGVLTIISSVQNPSPFALTIAWTGPSQHVQTGSTVTLDGRGSDLVDNELVTESHRISYMWKIISKPEDSTASWSGVGISYDPMPSFVADKDGEYVIKLFTEIGSEPNSTDTIRVIASSGNSAPVAEAGPHQEVKPGTLVTLDGTSSSDADGDPLTYIWSFDSNSPEAILSDDASPTPSFMPQEGEYRLRLEVDDGLVRSREDFVTVRASTHNSRPVAIAGPDQIVAAGTPVALDADASFDVDGDTLTYSWRILSSEYLSTTITASGSKNATVYMGSGGFCIVQLKVNDGKEWNRRLRDDTNLDRLVIRAATPENVRPIANAGPDQPSATVGVVVDLDGSGSSDQDNDVLTYAWSFDQMPGGSTAVLNSPTTSSPSFIPDLEGEYVVMLVVSDGQLESDPDYITVTTSSGGSAIELTLQTTLPYTPAELEMAIQIQIDADGADTIRVISSSSPDASTSSTVLQGHLNIPQVDEAYFYTVNPDWNIISQTHDNPVQEDSSPTFIVQRAADNIYYRIDIDFTGSPATQSLTVDNLGAWRCGSDQGDCP